MIYLRGVQVAPPHTHTMFSHIKHYLCVRHQVVLTISQIPQKYKFTSFGNKDG